MTWNFVLLFRSRANLRPSPWPRQPRPLLLRCKWFLLGLQRSRWSSRRSSSSRWWLRLRHHRSRLLPHTAPPSRPQPPPPQSPRPSSPPRPSRPPRVRLAREASEPKLQPNPAEEAANETEFSDFFPAVDVTALFSCRSVSMDSVTSFRTYFYLTYPNHVSADSAHHTQ